MTLINNDIQIRLFTFPVWTERIVANLVFHDMDIKYAGTIGIPFSKNDADPKEVDEFSLFNWQCISNHRYDN